MWNLESGKNGATYSIPEQEHFSDEERTYFAEASKKRFLRSGSSSDQGILVPKRTAVLRSEMLKRVQHDAKGRYRLQDMLSREENLQSIQGFNASEEVIPTSALGSFSLCHPELVSGSGFFEERGWG